MLPLCPVVAVSHANADRPQPATRAGVIDHNKAFLARGLADTKACFGARAIRYDLRRLQL
jgi:hypothetical protein